MEQYGIQTQEKVKALRVMMMLNPDLKLGEIAKAAGVFPSNLSNVVNGKAGKLMAANYMEKVFAVLNADNTVMGAFALAYDVAATTVALKAGEM